MKPRQQQLGEPRLVIEPLTVTEALELVKAWHRHLPDLQGGLFAAGLSEHGELIGVAIAGNPPQEWQATGRIVISRVAVREGHKNGCTKLYGSMCRAAAALGWREAWTYTLPEEPGTSLRAAGFRDMGLTDGGDHDRPGRTHKPAVRPEPKRRWARALA